MDTKKTIGIWMDHSTAIFIEFNDSNANRTIESDFTHNEKVDALHRSEHLMHNKEQQLQDAHFKKIAEQILMYDRVLLFGPTNAKSELHNYLRKDLHFKDVKIDIEPADKMTDNKKYAFVKKHFKK